MFPHPEDLAILNSPAEPVAPVDSMPIDAMPTDTEAEPVSEYTAAEDKIEDEDLKKDIEAVCIEVDQADRGLRDFRNRLYKKLAMYWDGEQILYYDEQLAQYAPVSQAGYLINSEEDIDLEEYNKVVNIFKPFGQSIIAALTVRPPKVKYIPSDADIEKDNQTAKTYELIQKKKIEKFNDPEELITKFCKIKYNQGLVFGYIYARENAKLGYYEEPVLGTREKQTPVVKCPACGQSYPALNNEVNCEKCGYVGEGILDIDRSQEEYTEDYTISPKHEICIELYGPLNVEIPLFVTDLEQVPVLTLTTEMHYADVMEQLKLNVKPSVGENPNDQRWTRLPNRYVADTDHLVTVKQRWIRPWAFNILEEDKREKYKKEYPEGCYCIFVDDILVKIEGEALEDHWVVAKDPLEDHLQGMPTGKDTVDIQDMTNEMWNFSLDAMEHAVPETFVTPTALDLDQYKSQRARPGNITQAKPRSGQNLQGEFFETHPATMSQEHSIFATRLFETGQFVSAAMPTIYGGALKGGSNTASEYEKTRMMSLQRLNPQWSIIKRFYAGCMRIAVPMYAALMKTDEKIVEESGGAYINVMIEKSKLEGEVGDITFDVNEAIPSSWAEQREVVMNLLPNATPGSLMDRIFNDPDNLSVLGGHLGIESVKIPFIEDREKQLAEIQELIKAEPMPNPKAQMFEQSLQTDLTTREALMRGEIQPPAPRTSSIPVDPLLDNHMIEGAVTASWLKSAVGRWYRVNMPEAWQNVYLHFTEHDTIVRQQQMQQQQTENKDNKGKENDKKDSSDSKRPGA